MFRLVVRVTALLVLLVIAIPSFAAYAARDLYVPVAGRLQGHGGRGFFTTVTLTNTSDEEAEVQIAVLRADQANRSPRVSTVRIAPAGTRILEVDEKLLGTPDGVGALHVESSTEILATAELQSRFLNDPPARSLGASINAIPASMAIGAGESTVLHGIAGSGFAYKLYLVETIGHPLYVTLFLDDTAGRTLAQKRYFLSAREQRTIDITQEFASVRGAKLRVHGFNGSGKVIAMGAQIALDSRDTTPFEMSLPTKSRSRMTIAEGVAYAAVAIAIIVVVLGRARIKG